MARKISPELLEKYEGELSIWKTKKTANGEREQRFDTIMNFDFEIVYRVSFGAGNGSGTVYNIQIPGENPRYIVRQ